MDKRVTEAQEAYSIWRGSLRKPMADLWPHWDDLLPEIRGAFTTIVTIALQRATKENGDG